MSERISYTNQAGESTGHMSSTERWYGAAAGFGGCLITLLIGGIAMTIVEELLTIGPGGPNVRSLLHFERLSFFFGLWLVIPATIAGYRYGFDRTVRALSYFWCSAAPPKPKLSIALWSGLMLLCFLTGWLIRLSA